MQAIYGPVDPLNREPGSSNKSELEPTTRTAPSQEQPERTVPKSTTSDLPNKTSCSNTSDSTPQITPAATPDDSARTTCAHYDANVHIQSLQQQLYIAEQHIFQLRERAAQRWNALVEQVQALERHNADLDGNVHYLLNQLEIANGVNQGLNRELQQLKRTGAPPSDYQRLPTAHVQNASSQQERQSCRIAGNSLHRAPVPIAPRPPPPTLTLQTQILPTGTANAALDNPNIMLTHAQATIRSLRAEIRTLKTSKNDLQDHFLRLADKAKPDDFAADFLKGYGLPPHVMEKWLELLRGRDRKIAGLEVLVQREREVRARMEKERCDRCGPVVVTEEEDDDEEEEEEGEEEDTEVRFPTVEEVKAAIPKVGIAIVDLVELFGQRVRGGQKEVFVDLVIQAGKQDRDTKLIFPKDF